MQKSKAQRSGELSTRVAVETLMAYADVSEARPSPTVFEIEIRFERELTDDIEVFEQEFKSLYEEWRASKTKIDAKRFMAAMAIRQFVIELDENKALKPLHGNPIKIDFHNIAIGPKDKGQRNGTYDVFMKFNVPAYNQYNAVAWLDDQLQRVCYNQNGMAGMYEFTWKGHIKDRQKFRKAEADFIEALKHVHVNGTNPDMPGTLEQMAGERGLSITPEMTAGQYLGMLLEEADFSFQGAMDFKGKTQQPQNEKKDAAALKELADSAEYSGALWRLAADAKESGLWPVYE
jgi:hypothetical protein